MKSKRMLTGNRRWLMNGTKPTRKQNNKKRDLAATMQNHIHHTVSKTYSLYFWLQSLMQQECQSRAMLNAWLTLRSVIRRCAQTGMVQLRLRKRLRVPKTDWPQRSQLRYLKTTVSSAGFIPRSRSRRSLKRRRFAKCSCRASTRSL